MCDTMVALGNTTQNRQTIFAKNSDRPGDECQPLVQHEQHQHNAGAVTNCQFVSFPEAETTYRHVGSRPYWCWGYEHGFNEHQVVIGNEALHSKLETASEPKLIGMELIRLGLERGSTAAKAVEAMTDLIGRHGQGKFENDAGVRTYDNGYIVADPNEAYVIETAGHEWAVKQVENTLGISNVYSVETDWTRISPGVEKGRPNFADTYTKASRSEGSGARRRGRSCTLLKQRTNEIDVRTMMAILSDHSNGESPDEPFQTEIQSPPSICVHCNEDGTGGNTAASLVADLCTDGSRLPVYWCSMYSPCLGLFLPMFIEGNLPQILSVGSAEPQNNSPWWQFHKLSRLARSEPEERIGLVREQWSTVQDRLFQSAYEIATTGREIIDQGQKDKAEQLLSGYMEENVTEMLQMVSEMIATFENQAVAQHA